MSVAEKVAKMIIKKRQDEQVKVQITQMLKSKKKLLEEQLKEMFTWFYNQVSAYADEGSYLAKEVNEKESKIIYLFSDKLITLSFVNSIEESKAVVDVDYSVLGDMKYDLNVRYSESIFNWYHLDKVLTSDSFEEFMDEILLKAPF